jgi:hypothetical protein
MEKQIDIKITVQEAETIMKALVKLPFEQVAQLVTSFDQQVRSQIEELPK